MKVVVDSREQSPYSFEAYDCEVIEGGLVTGVATGLPPLHGHPLEGRRA